MSGRRSDEELEVYLPTVIVGELESPGIEVVAYDAGWRRQFAAERTRIHAALGGRERRIEHIGSTAVPGLVAKPIVDILLVVDDAADKPAYLPALEAAGYKLRVREPGFHEHRMLRTPEKDVHVHVYSPDSPEIARNLLFRDHLRADAADRELYAETKRRLTAQSWPTMQHYAEAKTSVIEAILARAAEE